MKLKDTVCEFCMVKSFCSKSRDKCAPLSWVNGDVPRHEKLVSELKNVHEMEYVDSNDILSERIEDCRERGNNQLVDILCISEPSKRAAALFLWAGFSREQTASMLHFSNRHVNRLINGK